MLRLANYDIVFQEVPDEVTLALNISGCPIHCQGCHSPHLWEETGEVLNDESLQALLKLYDREITCVCFMGGDAHKADLSALCDVVHHFSPALKTAWYSGGKVIPEWVNKLSYIKIGPFMEEKGGLSSPTTNQRFYQVTEGKLIDVTHIFYKKSYGMVEGSFSG